MARIYGKVEGPKDIRRINCIIRDEMLKVQTPEQLTDLKKRSDYLCTLTYSPFWLKKFGPMIERLRETALEENRATVRLANYVAKYRGWDKFYEPWGRDKKSIDERLKEIPKEVIKEVLESVVELTLSPEILEELRKNFCEIRKAMVFVEDPETLLKLKRQSDLIVALSRVSDFKERFLETFSQIEQLLEVEEERTVELANIIADVNGWKLFFERWDESQVLENQTLEEYIKKLLQEEEKASSYIPSQAKYKEGKVLWLVYRHSRKNREFAKRVYLPGSAKSVKLEGPGIFKNRFGKEVFGVKITYEAKIEPAVVKVGERKIHLPERWVKREKVIPLPKEAENIRLLDEKPPVAYPVA